jgi:hypothetical protein
VGSLSLRPGDSLTIPRMALSVGFIRFVSSANATQATGSLTITPVGLPPTEHASPRWSHFGQKYSRGGILSEDFRNNTCRELISEAFLETMPVEDQIPKVHSHKMQYGCVEIVNADAVLHGFVSDVICCTVDVTPLYSSARHPEAEAAWTMVATNRIALAKL